MGGVAAILSASSTVFAAMKTVLGERVIIIVNLGWSGLPKYQSGLPRLTVTRTVKHDGGERRLVKDFTTLSFGQQQSVLLALMLSSKSTIPLVIDQPEDDLDGEFIYGSIVPALRLAKERRQIIVVTHNANIAVLGDAEQIIVLKSTAERAIVHATGSIDDPATRDAACNILEGHRDALKRRASIYGFDIRERDV